MMKRALLFFPSLALVAAFSGARPLYAEGAAAPPAAREHEHAQQRDAGQPAAPDAARTQPPAVGAHRMMQSSSAVEAELTRLLEAMNAATGADKTSAMAALLNHLVQDRLAIPAMMRGSMPSSMPQCSMMSKDSSGKQHEH